ncbi:SRPBCC family protein [Acinetobacter sp. Marseille-Q1618]|uniref:SRPBCC family protein n=1 Tax=Acinetobacter sp. Marseille-Q1618 TaxID=2697502 RepID=UPI00156EBFD8|nr:SRPBCC family protein [Acinetobacter sp. Marseille-Q1618]
MGNTIQLHRVFSAPPERVYKAFLDPDALVKWMAPHGFTAQVQHLEARVGGTYKMSFTNFSTGTSHSFGGTYQELIPNQRIRYTDQFDDPNLQGEIEMLIELKAVMVGTEVTITQSGIPAVIPTEACYLGWQESLQLLSLLVNPNIPDQ